MNNSGEKSAVWKNHITEQTAIGLTQSEHCKAKNIKHSTFLYWKKRLAEQTKAGSFIELPFSNTNVLMAKPRIYFRMTNETGSNDRLYVFVHEQESKKINILVENAIHSFAIGRKNWLFSGSPRGAASSAMLYSLVDSAKANGIEPYWYLYYLFEKFPFAQSNEEIMVLMPHRVDPAKIKEFQREVG